MNAIAPPISGTLDVYEGFACPAVACKFSCVCACVCVCVCVCVRA